MAVIGKFSCRYTVTGGKSGCFSVRIVRGIMRNDINVWNAVVYSDLKDML